MAVLAAALVSAAIADVDCVSLLAEGPDNWLLVRAVAAPPHLFVSRVLQGNGLDGSPGFAA